ATRKVKAAYLESVYDVPISVGQKASLRDDPVIGPLWVSKFALPRSVDDSSRDALVELVDEANVHQVHYDRPDSAPLKFEWVGYRSNVKKDTPEPVLSEKEKFDNLTAEATSPLTIFYIYGGMFISNNPCLYRRKVASLAQTTGARVLMVEQRLAPQNPFPAALLDIFQAYLTLLYPPPGSFHDPVPAPSIVIAGDSAGAAHALSLIQIILQLQRRRKSLAFHNTTIRLSSKSSIVPAGIAAICPVTDNTNSFPSFDRNAYCDIYHTPIEKLPYLDKRYPTDHIWPTKPPRAHFYCEAGMLAHPLVSPAAAEDWTGSCPVWFGLGQEQIQDSIRFLAREIHFAGASVTLREYECMPHDFNNFYRTAPQTKQILAKWAEAIVRFGKNDYPPSSACFVRAQGLKEERLEMEGLVDMSLKDVQNMMWEKTQHYKVPPWHREGGGSNL
ncbi:hypothetical protein N7456_005232, partial [Penicillium angulare]